MGGMNDKDRFENFLQGENPKPPVAGRVLERLEAKASWPQSPTAPTAPSTPPTEQISVPPAWVQFLLRALTITAIVTILLATFLGHGKPGPRETSTQPPTATPIKPTAKDVKPPAMIVATPHIDTARNHRATSVADDLGIDGFSRFLARNEPEFNYDLDNTNRTIPPDINTI